MKCEILNKILKFPADNVVSYFFVVLETRYNNPCSNVIWKKGSISSIDPKLFSRRYFEIGEQLQKLD